MSEGVLLLDADLNAHFLNKKIRAIFWRHPRTIGGAASSYGELIANTPHASEHGVPPQQLGEFFAERVEAVRSATPAIRDAETPDGRRIRVHCTITASGGRMMTYCDVTDLIRNAELLEKLATIDSMTGLYNRRHFLTLAEAEWSRFQRYQRPLSMLMIDIDHFKSINDRYGHAVGDQAIISVATACQQGKRDSDVGRPARRRRVRDFAPGNRFGAGYGCGRAYPPKRRRSFPVRARCPVQAHDQRRHRRRHREHVRDRCPAARGRSGALPGKGRRAKPRRPLVAAAIGAKSRRRVNDARAAI